MKIVVIGRFPPPINGPTVATKCLVEGLKKKHNVIVLRMTGKSKIGNLDTQGHFEIRKFTEGVLYNVWACLRIGFCSKCDSVYVTPASSWLGFVKYVAPILIARIRRLPTFIHIHGAYFRKMYDNLRPWKKKMVYKTLMGLAGAIVLGPSLRFMFEDLVPDEKIFVCENGVEDEVFATEEEIRQKIERYNTDDTIRVVYLSNLMESKGILDLFEAVKMLRKGGEKIHLDVAGAIEPVIEDRVEAYLKELGDSATYHGVVEGRKKKELLLNNYIFCLPSKHPYGEGQPISILEAMANGCLIVTTDLGGIKDIVNEAYGVFVEKNNPEAISRALFGEPIHENIILRSWHESNKYHVDRFVDRIEDILMLTVSRGDKRYAKS